MIRIAIFDLDGVIVDTAKFHYLSWRRLATELGFEFSEADNERLKGVSRSDSLEIMLRIGGKQGVFTRTEKGELAEMKNRWYVEYIMRMAPEDMLPGVRELLGDMREEGVKIGLGSASRNAGIILDRLEIGGLFDAVVDGTMVGRTKPNPEVFLKCAALLGFEPGDDWKQCVVFEDAVAGIEAAKTAGMYAVGIGQDEILAPAGADMVITGFEGVRWVDIKSQLMHR